ncbi:MAG: hypothetical protein ABSB35_28035 [Bryobacteraceae bacterium]
MRHAIGSDPNLDPRLRKELLSRIEKIDVNPIECSWDQEIRDGWRQYDALMADTRATGLARVVDGDRGDEMLADVHGRRARALFRMASIATAGLYRHHDTMNDSLMSKLDQQRRDARLKLPVQLLPPERDLVVASGANNSSPALASLGGGGR